MLAICLWDPRGCQDQTHSSQSKLTLFTKRAQGFSPFGPTLSQFPETNSLVMICHDSFGESTPSSAVLNHPSFSYLWSTDMRTASYLFVPSPVARLAWIRNQFLVLRYLADRLIGGLEYPLSFDHCAFLTRYSKGPTEPQNLWLSAEQRELLIKAFRLRCWKCSNNN